MTSILTEMPAAIDEADAHPLGSEFGRVPGDPDRSLGDRYIYLRFKPGGGQPVTLVRVLAR